jgi:hypothetical protein
MYNSGALRRGIANVRQKIGRRHSGAMPTGPREAPTRWDHPGMTVSGPRRLPFGKDL